MSESKPRCPKCYGMNGSLSVERRPDGDAICSCGWSGKYKLCFYDPLDIQDNDVLQDKVYHLTRKVEEQIYEIAELKAAYEEAQAKIKQLGSQYDLLNELLLENKLLKNQLCFTNSSWPHEKQLHEKIEQLKSDNEKLQARMAACAINKIDEVLNEDK